jgi:predicted NAD/FAD-binding protein
MPRTRRAWASWNYTLVRGAHGGFAPATHYWMNRLQGVSEREQYFVSIERPGDIEPARVLRRIGYAHPRFTRKAVRAQEELPGLNAAASGSTETYFAGSYFRYGFHEDAFLSAMQLGEQLLQRDPWTRSARGAAEQAVA